MAQVVGATIGAAFIYFIASRHVGGYDIAAMGLGQNGWDPAGGYSTGAAFLIEVVATFVFAAVILGVTHPRHETMLAGLVIGLTLAILHFAFIPVSGNSLNPARSIGPALFVGGTALGQLWLYRGTVDRRRPCWPPGRPEYNQHRAGPSLRAQP